MIEDRIHEGKPARFVTFTDALGKVRELGYFIKPEDPEYNRKCDRGLLASVELEKGHPYNPLTWERIDRL